MRGVVHKCTLDMDCTWTDIKFVCKVKKTSLIVAGIPRGKRVCV